MVATLTTTPCPAPEDPDLAELGAPHGGCPVCHGREVVYALDGDPTGITLALVDVLRFYVEDNTLPDDLHVDTLRLASALDEYVTDLAVAQLEARADG